MIGFVMQFDSKSQLPKYIQLYQFIKGEIHAGNIGSGTKLPSVRSVSESLNISKSTVENAYAQLLAEGYVESKPKSGYFVNQLSLYDVQHTQSLVDPEPYEAIKCNDKPFNTDAIEERLFDFTGWKKAINQVLEYEANQLLYYGDVQGEYELRKEITKFIHETRGVICTPGQVIIGAGVQSLFIIIALLLKTYDKRMAFESPGFYKGATIFEDLGFETVDIPVKRTGIDLEKLMESDVKTVYVSPSHQFPTGSIMPINNRIKLLNWAKREGAFIIEDDYDSLLRYEGAPIPSLQGLNEGNNVIYVGAFSKLLLPSLRISFMVLPNSLLKEYKLAENRYSQTVSKIEQLTLAEFMKSGNFDRHIRKIRKVYGKKNTRLIEALKQIDNPHYKVIGKASGLHIMFAFDQTIDIGYVSKDLAALGIKFDDAGIYEGKKIAILSYSGLRDEDILEVVELIDDKVKKYLRSGV